MQTQVFEIKEQKEFFNKLFNQKFNSYLWFLISFLLINFPILIRFFYSGSIFPAKAYFIFSDFTHNFSAIGIKFYNQLMFLVNLFPDQELFMLLFNIIFSFVFLLIIFQLFERFNVKPIYSIVFAMNYLILKYMLILSTTLFSFLLFFTFIFLLIFTLNNLDRISSFFHKMKINLGYYFIAMILLSTYLLIFAFSLNQLLIILFVILIFYFSRYYKEKAYFLYIFMFIVLFFYIFFDFRYFAINNLSTKENLQGFEILKEYFVFWKENIFKYWRDSFIVKGFIYNYDQTTFAKFLNSFYLNYPRFFFHILSEEQRISLGDVIVKLYNIFSYFFLFYEVFVIIPGILFFIFVFLGIVNYRRYFRFLSILLFFIIFSFLDPHYLLIFAIVSVFLFIKGFEFLYEKFHYKDLLLVIFVILIFSNYLFFIIYFKNMTPSKEVYFLDLSNINSNVIKNYKTDFVCSDLDLSFVFLEKGFFKVNEFTEFYKRIMDYSIILTVPYGQSLEYILEKNNCKYFVFTKTTSENSYEKLKNFILEENSFYFYTQLHKINQIKFNELKSKILFNVTTVSILTSN